MAKEARAYVQNLQTGEIESTRRSLVVKLTGTQDIKTLSKDGWKHVRTAPPIARRVSGKELDELLVIQKEINTLTKNCGGKRDNFNRAVKWVMQKFNQAPSEFIEKFDERMQYVESDDERKLFNTARNDLLIGFQMVIPGEKRTAELRKLLRLVAREFLNKRGVAEERARIDALKTEHRHRREVEAEVEAEGTPVEEHIEYLDPPKAPPKPKAKRKSRTKKTKSVEADAETASV